MYKVTHNSTALSVRQPAFWGHKEIWSLWLERISSLLSLSFSLTLSLCVRRYLPGSLPGAYRYEIWNHSSFKDKRGIKNVSLNMDLAQTNKAEVYRVSSLMFSEHKEKLFPRPPPFWGYLILFQLCLSAECLFHIRHSVVIQGLVIASVSSTADCAVATSQDCRPYERVLRICSLKSDDCDFSAWQNSTPICLVFWAEAKSLSTLLNQYCPRVQTRVECSYCC